MKTFVIEIIRFVYRTMQDGTDLEQLWRIRRDTLKH